MKKTVFVFGSNLRGIHGAGAALEAKLHYGAQTGVGEGRTGMAYAIPTKITPSRARRQMPLDGIQAAVERFIAYATSESDEEFLITRIGCGLAGYEDEEIAPMFIGVPDNCVLPPRWKKLRKYEREKVCSPDRNA
jgi:hypothetical protein